jgi:hypothetical protein
MEGRGMVAASDYMSLLEKMPELNADVNQNLRMRHVFDVPCLLTITS